MASASPLPWPSAQTADRYQTLDDSLQTAERRHKEDLATLEQKNKEIQELKTRLAGLDAKQAKLSAIVKGCRQKLEAASLPCGLEDVLKGLEDALACRERLHRRMADASVDRGVQAPPVPVESEKERLAVVLKTPTKYPKYCMTSTFLVATSSKGPHLKESDLNIKAEEWLISMFAPFSGGDERSYNGHGYRLVRIELEPWEAIVKFDLHRSTPMRSNANDLPPTPPAALPKPSVAPSLKTPDAFFDQTPLELEKYLFTAISFAHPLPYEKNLNTSDNTICKFRNIVDYCIMLGKLKRLPWLYNVEVDIAADWRTWKNNNVSEEDLDKHKGWMADLRNEYDECESDEDQDSD